MNSLDIELGRRLDRYLDEQMKIYSDALIDGAAGDFVRYREMVAAVRAYRTVSETLAHIHQDIMRGTTTPIRQMT